MFYIVHFHADGGQACIDGTRCYPKADKDKAEAFAENMKNQPGHHCRNSVWIEEVATAVPDKGRVLVTSQTFVKPGSVTFRFG